MYIADPISPEGLELGKLKRQTIVFDNTVKLFITSWLSVSYFPTIFILAYFSSFSFFFKEILSNLCDNFLEKNVSTIVYLTNSELFGRSTASSQYFLQLASYLGIPVIAWNADNSGLERRVSPADKRTKDRLPDRPFPNLELRNPSVDESFV